MPQTIAQQSVGAQGKTLGKGSGGKTLLELSGVMPRPHNSNAISPMDLAMVQRAQQQQAAVATMPQYWSGTDAGQRQQPDWHMQTRPMNNGAQTNIPLQFGMSYHSYPGIMLPPTLPQQAASNQAGAQKKKASKAKAAKEKAPLPLRQPMERKLKGKKKDEELFFAPPPPVKRPRGPRNAIKPDPGSPLTPGSDPSDAPPALGGAAPKLGMQLPDQLPEHFHTLLASFKGMQGLGSGARAG
eukprot:1902852-Rhodomonas_salina.1